LERIKKIN